MRLKSRPLPGIDGGIQSGSGMKLPFPSGNMPTGTSRGAGAKLPLESSTMISPYWLRICPLESVISGPCPLFWARSTSSSSSAPVGKGGGTNSTGSAGGGGGATVVNHALKSLSAPNFCTTCSICSGDRPAVMVAKSPLPNRPTSSAPFAAFTMRLKSRALSGTGTGEASGTGAACTGAAFAATSPTNLLKSGSALNFSTMAAASTPESSAAMASKPKLLIRSTSSLPLPAFDKFSNNSLMGAPWQINNGLS